MPVTILISIWLIKFAPFILIKWYSNINRPIGLFQSIHSKLICFKSFFTIIGVQNCSHFFSSFTNFAAGYYAESLANSRLISFLSIYKLVFHDGTFIALGFLSVQNIRYTIYIRQTLFLISQVLKKVSFFCLLFHSFSLSHCHCVLIWIVALKCYIQWMNNSTDHQESHSQPFEYFAPNPNNCLLLSRC